MKEILNIRNLNFAYGKQEILENVNLKINPGECVGILGSNGSGKTTLINCILGENNNYECVELFGKKYDGKDNEIKKIIGVVPDNEFVIDYLTMIEYLRFVGNVFQMSNTEMDAIIEKWSYKLKMENYYNKALKNFSHGMKKKVQLIAALMHNPKLLIIDEPTNGLDIETIAELKGIIEALKENGIAIIISTHILEFAEKVCDSVMILNQNKLSDKMKINTLDKNLEEVFINYISGEKE